MTTTLTPGMQSTAMSFDGNTVWTTDKTWQASSAFSISCWVQTTDSDALTAILGGGTLGTYNMYISHLSTGAVVFHNVDSSLIGVHVTTNDNFILHDGIPHHIVVTHDNATVAGIHIYLDGTDRPVTTSGTVINPTIFDTIGGPFANTADTAIFTGLIQDVAVFNKQLSAAEVLAFYQRSKGYLEESSAARVGRLLDDVGWPASWRDITTNPRATVGDLVYNSATVASRFAEIQNSEQGRIFAGKDNHLVFLSRYYASEVTAGSTVQQIFSDDGGATALPYSTFGFEWHEVDVTNDVTVTTPTTWAAASDAASITANDRQSKKVDTILTTFTAADSMARGLVAQYKDPKWRATPIMVYPASNTARWANVLGLELGHRAQIEITPVAVGSQNVQEVTIEQIEWTITPGLWAFTMTGSPAFGGASGASPGWFVIGQSLIGGTDVIGY